MDKDALLAQLQKMGVDTEAMQMCDPGALAEMVRVLSDKSAAAAQAAPAADPNAPPPANQNSAGDVAAPAQAAPAVDPAAATEPEKVATPTVEKQGDMVVTHKGDGDKDEKDDKADMVQPPEGAPPEKFAAYHTAMAKKFSAMCSKYSEQNDPRYRAIEERLARAEKMARDREDAERKALVATRLDNLVRAGKVLPAERGTLDDAILAIPGEAIVKFSENGVAVQKPVIDRILDALESRPVLVRFSERVASVPAKTGVDAEIVKIEEHYEKFSESFTKANVSREKLVAGFTAERKSRPGITAEEYLSV